MNETKTTVKMNSGVEREQETGQVPSLDYTDEEKQYLGALRKRLQRARDMRDGTQDFFDGMTYIERCRQNRLLATGYVKPRTNRNEVNFTTKSSRQKMMVQLASLATQNLSVDITAFNSDKLQVPPLSDAMEDILDKCQEIDNDEEKKIRRQYTMLEQGEVFVEALWQKGFYLRKVIEGTMKGQFRGVKIKRMLKKALDKLTTNIIMNEKVYLGNILLFDMEVQPFVFTIDNRPIEELELIFGEFENWKYVQSSMQYFDSTTEDLEGFSPYFRLNVYKKGVCEVLRYQSKPDNELQILINGIPMLPIGYPLSEVSPDGEYMIVKQVLSLIDEHYAYGMSLMQLLRTAGVLEDEFWKLAILKGQQSFLPPMVNNSGKILSSRIFMPGAVLNNVSAEKIKLLLEGNTGVTNGEIAVLKMLRDNIDENSTNPQVGGQTPSGNPTATEINRVQVQAEKMLNLTVLMASLLEKKLAQLSISILLKNWFDPVDTKIDDIKKGIVEVYRTINVERPIDGEGMGQEIVEVKKGNMPTSLDIFKEEQKIKKETGVPTRKIVLNRDQIVGAKYLFRVSVVPQPKKSSALNKLMFREKASVYAQSPNFNMDWYEENAALTWGDNPEKVFKRQPQQTQAEGVVSPMGGNNPNNPDLLSNNRVPLAQMSMREE